MCVCVCVCVCVCICACVYVCARAYAHVSCREGRAVPSTSPYTCYLILAATTASLGGILFGYDLGRYQQCPYIQ